MAYVPDKTMKSVIAYLELIKADAIDDDMKLSIKEIEDNLLSATIQSKSDVLDVMENLIQLTDSLKVHMFIMEEKSDINIKSYSYLLSEAVVYINNQLIELYESLNTFDFIKEKAIWK